MYNQYHLLSGAVVLTYPPGHLQSLTGGLTAGAQTGHQDPLAGVLNVEQNPLCTWELEARGRLQPHQPQSRRYRFNTFKFSIINYYIIQLPLEI